MGKKAGVRAAGESVKRIKAFQRRQADWERRQAASERRRRKVERNATDVPAGRVEAGRPKPADRAEAETPVNGVKPRPDRPSAAQFRLWRSRVAEVGGERRGGTTAPGHEWEECKRWSAHQRVGG